uniref:ATP-dependent DNA helicase RecG n=1 Tax=uncultured prokaryote AT3 TaxID=672202 RepID=D3W8G5_9ZZZZ|nr:putative ATP-dependent DNA helicase RecG [uncultured prokaryote AT3]
MAGSTARSPATTKAGDAKPSAERNPLQAKLAKLGLHRAIDCALHLPLRYEDETVVVAVADAPFGEVTQVEVTVDEVTVQFRPRRQLVVRCHDDSGPLVLRFINFYGSQTKQFEGARDLNRRLRLFGEVRAGFFGDEMVHPRVRLVAENHAELPDRLTPVYPTTAGLSQAALRKIIGKSLAQVDLSPTLPADSAPELPAVDQAVRYLHAPPPDADVTTLQEHTHPCWRRLKFEELVAQQLSLKRAYLARRERGAPPLLPTGEITNALLASLPFQLTAAQQRVWQELRTDLVTPHPMQRLLQGDVGSGKTVVAALAACQAIEAGYQAAFMAPTEILAEQHYQKLAGWLTPLGISVLWLAGSLKAAEKKLRQAEAAHAQLIVGTHALIQDAVDFSRLGIAIVDEQHRFGVAQRLALRKKGAHAGSAPHQLMMSATPIPRTLAMTYFADLDVSVLDELPPGRTPIRTKLVSDARRGEVIERIRTACAEGRQVYWVCPLIEESEAIDLQPAIDTHALLTEALPEFAVGLVHGRLKADEKAWAMAEFNAGRTQVLVATTVIEVGVDVPNASLMVIEHAERFGLSQLHQLRGRVGRGTADSVCILIYAAPLSQTARERLKIIYENTDGFEIARADLHLRGPGEFIGHRQSGAPLLRYADLETDVDLAERARDLAERLLRADPATAERHLQRWLAGREELLKA